ncbi:MAG: type I restriction enzyme HsdR N-terminal domain-containing protein, partial [Bacteroidia bacterium]|nr:type I restriction enzyme HsdR N-terminal domain-containing protein [Bacteroidia bacterium]
MPFSELNLPSFEFRIREEGQRKQIFDSLRKRFVALTPEEWVRQHFIRFLTEAKRYPASLINVERGVKIISGTKRTDIVVHNRHGKPWMIVECKAPDMPVTEDALLQAARYNMALQATFLVLTNGMEHYCCTLQNKQIEFLDDLPEFE